MSNNFSNNLKKEPQENVNMRELQEDINNREEIMFDEIKLLRIQYLSKSKKIKVILKSPIFLDKEKEIIIKKVLQKKLYGYDSIDLICYKDISNISLKEVIDKHWIDLIGSIVSKVPVSKECLLNSKREVTDSNFKIYFGNEFIVKLLKGKDTEGILRRNIEDIFGLKCEVQFIYKSELKDSDYYEKIQMEQQAIIRKSVNEKSQTQEKDIDKQVVKKMQSMEVAVSTENVDSSIILGKNINENCIDIIDIDDAIGNVTICGEIFKKEIIETKTGRKIVTFFITDYTNSITVKLFPKPKDVEKIVEEIKPGLYCKVRGQATNDPYAKEIVIMAKDIVKATKIEKMDTALEKRVELHLHTKMSSMDGLSSTANLIKQAAKWGHKAIAITDHGVVQAFPEAMETAKKSKIKILYGVEGYLVDDELTITIDARDKTIHDSFVVFDIETTGFSSVNDKIIEIGAVKVCGGKNIDAFSSFVNPKINIPHKITELTSITNEMVSDADDIESVLKKFMEFCEGSVLVAHNANFDVSFIKKNCNDYNIDFNYAVLDTIPFAKFLYPDLKRFKLDVICKYLGIALRNHHRAVDDASATANILLNGFKLLEEKEIISLQDLNDIALKNQDIKKLNTYHVIIFAQNMVGLKNLYNLISKSNLDYFYKKARLPKSLINEYREGLIVGSACEAGQIYKAVLQGKSEIEMKELVDFYDYLEIQPIDNNKFLIKKGIVKDRNELIEINKKICDIGELYNKLVVATCDVHFLEPKDEVFRRILMSGQGFSDADDQAPLYLRTTDEMLKEFMYLGQKKAMEVVVTNTVKIADMIEVIKPIPDETFPPKIPGAEDEIKKMTLDKVHSIYGDVLPEVVQKRLDKELNSIINNGYAVLYLIAQKLVAKSYEDGYLVGSRGSVGSSFVATMSNITEVNGLPPHYVCPKCKKSEFILDGSISSGADLESKNCPNCNEPYILDGHDIPFETFLGFEGDKEPDIDLNFSGEYQPVVHKYTEELFGRGYVFRAGTIGTVAEKTAYGFVRKYLDKKNIVLNSAEIERLTLGCTGVKRTSGQHPGGVMVVPNDNDIHNFTPIQHPADDTSTDIITTHFDYHSISGRLLKLDILGHDDPTVLRMLQDLTGVDPKSIPLGEPKVMSLFTSPNALGITKEELECEVGTYGLPEFGTKFVRQMLVDTKPKTFADLVRISGLSHGTDVWINNAQYYIKEGYTTLKDCISTRDDIMVYLMYAGLQPKTAFNIMEKVRKGKGLSEDDEKIMREFKVPEWYIESCKKIKYMFPKGHAVAYVMMAVRIAYFKVYYPLAYYATYFTVRATDFDAELITKGVDAVKDKMLELAAMGKNITQKDKGLITILEISFEMYKRGFKLLKVDLYKSEAFKFKVEDGAIRPPLSSLQGVGVNAAKAIVAVRDESKCEFISKEDLRVRTKVTKTVIETLSIHGCLQGLPETNQLSFF